MNRLARGSTRFWLGLVLGVALLPSCRDDVQSTADRPSAAKEPLESPASASTAAPQKSSDDSPVSARVRWDKSPAHAGDMLALIVDVDIADGWHIYAMELSTGPATPTAIQFELPARLSAAGKWSSNTAPVICDSGLGEPIFVHHGSVSFQCPVRVDQGASPGVMALRGSLRYQACDEFRCRPPADLALQTEIQIIP